MNGELAQCVALVIGGGRWLSGASGDRDGAPPDLATGSTFTYVRRIEFAFDDGRQTPVILGSTAEWLAGLRSRGANGLRVLIREGRRVMGMPRYHGAAFSGSDQWAIVANHDVRHAELWEPGWAVNTPNPASVEDRRIWDVRYSGRYVGPPPEAPVDAATSLRRVVSAVRAAHAFAGLAGWTDWADWLRKALDAAASDEPDLGFHADVLPPSTPLDVRRLFATAAQAWVFGGMGWWNDMGAPPGHDREYDDVTAELYDAVLGGIADAANLAAGKAGTAPAA